MAAAVNNNTVPIVKHFYQFSAYLRWLNHYLKINEDIINIINLVYKVPLKKHFFGTHFLPGSHNLDNVEFLYQQGKRVLMKQHIQNASVQYKLLQQTVLNNKKKN